MKTLKSRCSSWKIQYHINDDDLYNVKYELKKFGDCSHRTEKQIDSETEREISVETYLVLSQNKSAYQKYIEFILFPLFIYFIGQIRIIVTCYKLDCS